MTNNARQMGFTGSPLDRADQMRTDPAAVHAARMNPASRYLILEDLKPLMTEDRQDLYWARRSETPDGTIIFLGLTEEGAPRFAIDGRADDDIPARAVDARTAGAVLGDGRAEIVAQARSLLDWHRRHGFCSNCGSPTDLAKAGYSRLCEGCGTEHFPRIDPVVIMIPQYEDRILLGRGAAFPSGFFSAFAGFVEPGESLEEAVARELYEEAGLHVSNVRFGASQPWPFPCSLMIGAFADAQSTDFHLDQHEIAEARWVSRDEARAALRGETEWKVPPPLAIANWLIATWIDGRTDRIS